MWQMHNLLTCHYAQFMNLMTAAVEPEKGAGKGLCMHKTLFSFQYGFVSVSCLKLCSRHSVSIVNSCPTMQQPPKDKKHSRIHPVLKLLFDSVHTDFHVFFSAPCCLARVKLMKLFLVSSLKLDLEDFLLTMECD